MYSEPWDGAKKSQGSEYLTMRLSLFHGFFGSRHRGRGNFGGFNLPRRKVARKSFDTSRPQRVRENASMCLPFASYGMIQTRLAAWIGPSQANRCRLGATYRALPSATPEASDSKTPSRASEVSEILISGSSRTTYTTGSSCITRPTRRPDVISHSCHSWVFRPTAARLMERLSPRQTATA